MNAFLKIFRISGKVISQYICSMTASDITTQWIIVLEQSVSSEKATQIRKNINIARKEFYFIKSRDQILNSPNPSLFIMVAHLPSVPFSDPSQTEW